MASETTSERPDTGPNPRARGRSRTLLGLSGLSLTVGVALATALWLPREPHWIGSLLAALRPYLGLVALLALALLCGARRTRAALAAGGLAAFNLFPLFPLYFAPRASCGEGHAQLVLVSANLRVGTTDFTALFDWLERERPDVIALQEVQASMHAALAERALDYPYRCFVPEVPNPRDRMEMGVALLSRHPFERLEVDHTLWEGRPVIEAALRIEGQELVLLATHVMRPGRSELTLVRNRMVRTLAERAREHARVILLGDLNTTGTQPIFAELLERGRLRDTRRGFGWLPSWRSTRLVEGLPLDLDHVLASPELCVLDRRLGPDFGSDHLPVLVRLAIPRPASPAPPSPAR